MASPIKWSNVAVAMQSALAIAVQRAAVGLAVAFAMHHRLQLPDLFTGLAQPEGAVVNHRTGSNPQTMLCLQGRRRPGHRHNRGNAVYDRPFSMDGLVEYARLPVGQVTTGNGQCAPGMSDNGGNVRSPCR